MKYLLPIVIFASTYVSGSVLAAPPALCSTVTYSAFGEKEKTVRDCVDNNTENFFINAKINNYKLPTLAVGLEIPSWVSETGYGAPKAFIGQVTKQNGIYTVRVQIELNGKKIITSLPLEVGSTKTVTVNGEKIQVNLQRQVI
ncbi:hypothetical protein [Enterobacter bugandensis]|uniref:hypothetical protein n=1 Tax=Enterobacter bugandensis TaxID=881260 RepID=UPI0020765B59|nr:hypothetical protein [Enterobacter bugandensis]MCM7391746.1 hypothetical protein [Enterobacter bugandensis]